jgi:hypothetical protein
MPDYRRNRVPGKPTTKAPPAKNSGDNHTVARDRKYLQLNNAKVVIPITNPDPISAALCA